MPYNIKKSAEALNSVNPSQGKVVDILELIQSRRLQLQMMSDNAKRGIQYKLQNGEWIGKAPFGYKNITFENGKKGIVIDNDKSLIVKEIFNLYSVGKSLNDISEKFGLSKNIIYRTVNHHFYYGKMQVKGKLYIHKYDKIITKELFDKCQEILELKNLIRKTAKMPRL